MPAPKEVLELIDRFEQNREAYTSPGDKASIERQIATTDRQIDALVYELYGLSDEEIKIVEGTGS